MKLEVQVNGYYLPHLPVEHFPLAAHFAGTALSAAHFPLAAHFLLVEHFAPASASEPVVHPVNATIAKPTNAVKSKFFITSPLYFDSSIIILDMCNVRVA